MKKQVIGHRGAAGMALENSKAAITKAFELGATPLEIDVRQTKDARLVVCHDDDLKTMANDGRKINQLDWAELKEIKLRDGSRLLLLEDVLRLAGQQPLIIEAKEGDIEESLLKALDKFPQAQAVVASFKRPLLESLREKRPDMGLYILEHTKSLEAIQFAKRHKLQGIGLNFWLLSPSFYLQAKRAGLSVFVYTVNSRLLAWFLTRLYPQVTICTDYPERFS